MTHRLRKAILALAATLVADLTCSADGTVYRYDHKGGGFSTSPQLEQRAAIFFDGGRERLVITCQLDLDQEAKAVWIVPIPRDREGCKIDVEDTFPHFSGRRIASEFKAEIGMGAMLMAATQILPVPLFLLEGMTLSAPGGRDSVAVHSVVDKFGLHSEAVSADSAEALLSHLLAKGVTAEASDLEPFKDYLNSSWSLVVTWIASSEDAREHFRGRTPCMSAEFGTSRPFYPMKPTAKAYGHLQGTKLGVELLIWARGIWEVDCPAAIREKLQVEYFHGSARDENGDYGMDESYTRILSTGHISGFTEDFFLTPEIPLRTRGSHAFLDLPSWGKLAALVTFHLLYSILIGLLANLIVLGRGQGAWWIGICNVGTILGVVIAMGSLTTASRLDASSGNMLSRLPPSYGPRAVIRCYTITFILLFCIPLLLAAFL
jgi:hypothetical protein